MHAKLSLAALAAAALLSVSPASDAASAKEYLISQISQGGPVTIRDAAKSIYHSGEKDQEILDKLAEAVLQKYPTAMDNTSGDAIAWSCKALAASGNKRYYSVVKEAAEKSGHKGPRKHCDNAADALGSAEGPQYTAGMASLSAGASTASAAPSPAPAPAPATAPAGGGAVQPITEVKPGMSQAQVYAMCGAPTNTHSYQTGKAWVPFNFKGKDVMRTAALYKGQGRVVFSNDSAYSGEMRVLEVLVNPNESGYP